MNAVATHGRAMRRLAQTACAAVALAAGLPSLAAPAEPDSEPPVLTVGAEHWSARRLAWSMQAEEAPLSMDAQQLTRFGQTVSRRYILAREAEAAGLPQDPRIAERLAMARAAILADEQIARLRQLAPIDAAQVRARYDADPESHDEYRLSQILVRVDDGNPALPAAQRRTEAQALARVRSIQRQLQQGAHFKTLARKVSDDLDSRAQGGQLPEMFAMDLRPDLRPAITALQPQSISEPLRSGDGYHLVRLDEKISPAFEPNRRLLEFGLRDAWARAEVERLQRDAAVVVDTPAWFAQRDRLAAYAGTPSGSADGPAPQGPGAAEPR